MRLRYGNRVERLSTVEELKTGRLMGSNATHDALREAAQWFVHRKSTAERIVVLFTDGTPDDTEQTIEQVRELRKLGAKLLVGSIGGGLTNTAETLNGAVVFDVGCSPSLRAAYSSCAAGNGITAAANLPIPTDNSSSPFEALPLPVVNGG